MPRIYGRLSVALGVLLAIATVPALAADYPAPRETDWVAPGFTFHTGEVLPALRLHVTTVGDPSGAPVLILHGTAGNAASMLTPAYAGELFGPGQPLDARKYYLIIPDVLGAGASAKPSDGLRAQYPRYNYDDMVLAQYRPVTGNSMGGMKEGVLF